MGSLWTDLLFLHGHVTDLKLLRRLKDLPDSRAVTPSRQASDRKRLRWPFRFCLGIGDGDVRTQ
ncbi:hypothetical protein CH75_21690 [Dyella jiangningensis]|jgi:hypothetical protein|nr:hypothetical protein CH75_21690 [Dyella jiangningensis]